MKQPFNRPRSRRPLKIWLEARWEDGRDVSVSRATANALVDGVWLNTTGREVEVEGYSRPVFRNRQERLNWEWWLDA